MSLADGRYNGTTAGPKAPKTAMGQWDAGIFDEPPEASTGVPAGPLRTHDFGEFGRDSGVWGRGRRLATIVPVEDGCPPGRGTGHSASTESVCMTLCCAVLCCAMLCCAVEALQL